MGTRRRGEDRTAGPGSLCTTPSTPRHARLPDDGARHLRRVHDLHTGSEPGSDLVRPVSLPHADPDLHRQLPPDLPASRALTDVEPGRGGGVLCRLADPGLPAADGVVPRSLAAGGTAGRAVRAGRDQPPVAHRGQHHRRTADRGGHVASRAPVLVRRRHGTGGAAGGQGAVPRGRGRAVGLGAVPACLDGDRGSHPGPRCLVAATGQVRALRRHRDAGGGATGPR